MAQFEEELLQILRVFSCLMYNWNILSEKKPKFFYILKNKEQRVIITKFDPAGNQSDFLHGGSKDETNDLVIAEQDVNNYRNCKASQLEEKRSSWYEKDNKLIKPVIK